MHHGFLSALNRYEGKPEDCRANKDYTPVQETAWWFHAEAGSIFLTIEK